MSKRAKLIWLGVGVVIVLGFVVRVIMAAGPWMKHREQRDLGARLAQTEERGRQPQSGEPRRGQRGPDSLPPAKTGFVAILGRWGGNGRNAHERRISGRRCR